MPMARLGPTLDEVIEHIDKWPERVRSPQTWRVGIKEGLIQRKRLIDALNLMVTLHKSHCFEVTEEALAEIKNLLSECGVSDGAGK